jgi:polyisoprenoid-binding protein YceI
MKPKLCFALFLLIALTVASPAQENHLALIKDESSITYELVHPLHTIDAVSKDAVYVVDVDLAAKAIKHASVEVDVTTFDSGNSNRDSHAMEVIDALTYPAASFTSDSIAQQGDSISISGKLAFHGITKGIVLAGTTKWSPNKLIVEGGFGISLTAFNVERPSLLLVPVKDTLTFSIKAAFGWK